MTDPKIEDVLFVTEDQPRFRPGYGRRWYEQQDDRHAYYSGWDHGFWIGLIIGCGGAIVTYALWRPFA